MYPVLFQVGSFSVYSYGLLIAVGAVAGVIYMAIQGKKEVRLSFDQANALFLYIFFAALIGGKIFLFFEDTTYYLARPEALVKGTGFVFYGSFLFSVPTMLWFFHRQRLHTYKMLDVMAVTTCMVHMFGRIGCFMAGCCYGRPTETILGVVFNDPACYADPKGTPLHPTQLYEAAFIFMVMLVLFYLRTKRQFYGQLFLVYLLLYGVGRIVIEFFRGDKGRGYIFNGLSHSQFIAISILIIVGYIYWRWSKQNAVSLQ
jgi:phosphatidylglycerol---prolipoprotein diacylglyceryl transferase